jgi:hypothetical protein
VLSKNTPIVKQTVRIRDRFIRAPLFFCLKNWLSPANLAMAETKDDQATSENQIQGAL